MRVGEYNRLTGWELEGMFRKLLDRIGQWLRNQLGLELERKLAEVQKELHIIHWNVEVVRNDVERMRESLNLDTADRIRLEAWKMIESNKNKRKKRSTRR